MDKKNVLYIALELTPISQEILKKAVIYNEIKRAQLYSIYWQQYNIICHHMTIAFYTDLSDELYNWCVENENKEFELVATKIGYSNKAMAVQVETDCPSANKIKHITLATASSTNGKPVDSNYITDWRNIEPISLTGKLTFYYKKEIKQKLVIDHDNFNFIGIIFSPDYLNILKLLGEQYVKKLKWKHYNITAHHVTISHKDKTTKKIFKYVDEHLNEELEFKITKIGYNDKVIAVQVDGDFLSENKIPHLTLAINLDTPGAISGSAKEIDNWEDFTDFDYPIKGYLHYFR